MPFSSFLAQYLWHGRRQQGRKGHNVGRSMDTDHGTWKGRQAPHHRTILRKVLRLEHEELHVGMNGGKRRLKAPKDVREADDCKILGCLNMFKRCTRNCGWSWHLWKTYQGSHAGRGKEQFGNQSLVRAHPLPLFTFALLGPGCFPCWRCSFSKADPHRPPGGAQQSQKKSPLLSLICFVCQPAGAIAPGKDLGSLRLGIQVHKIT